MTSRSSTVKLKPTVWDGVIAAAVIAIAVIVAVVFYGNKTYSGELCVVVSVGNRVVDTLPLSDEESTHTYCHNGYTLLVLMDGSGVRVEQSDCPSQDCVHTGTITRAGQSIVCLPAQIVVHLEGASDDAPDVIVG